MTATKTKTKHLDSKFTDNINPIMMCVNNTNNARFGGRWGEVKQQTAKVRVYLAELDAVADEMLKLGGSDE